jgi:hypothetical protein
VVAGGELDENIHSVERFGHVAENRDADRLATEGGTEILAGAAASDGTLQGDVWRGERAVGNGAAGPAGRAGDAEVDVSHVVRVLRIGRDEPYDLPSCRPGEQLEPQGRARDS